MAEDNILHRTDLLKVLLGQDVSKPYFQSELHLNIMQDF